MKSSLSPSPVRGFTHTSRSWYGKNWLERNFDMLDEVIFGHYHFTPEGHSDGTTGEMTMVWKQLDDKPTARLNAYHDSWTVLAQMPDLVAALGGLSERDSILTPEQFCALLITLGFEDLTETVNPRE